MSENKKATRAHNLLKIGFLVLLGLVILLQMFNFKHSMLKSPVTYLRYLPVTAESVTYWFVPMVFGAVYSKRKLRFNEGFRAWCIMEATLLLYYIAFFAMEPWHLNAWRFWGMLFPVLTSTVVMMTGIIFALLVQPVIFDWQEKFSYKQSLIILSALTFLGFTLTAGTYQINYSLYGLYLILPFAWGMFLGKIHFTTKMTVWSVLAGLFTFAFVLVGVPGFNAVYWSQILAGHAITTSWNYQFLINVTSPLIFVIALAGFAVTRKAIAVLEEKDLDFLIPLIVFMQAPITSQFVASFKYGTGSRQANRLITMLIMLGIATLWHWFYERYLFRWKPIKRCNAFLYRTKSFGEVAEGLFDHLRSWIKYHRTNLSTWAFFFVVSFASFLIESDKLRIQISTAADVNAIVWILGTKFGTLILTTIFIDALFTILYFVTTRYWLSMVTTTVFVLGWAIANKIKLNLRGEPIYPSELSEAANAGSLLDMIGGTKTLILILVALALVIALIVFLEIKFKVKKRGNWKRRGLWALASLGLFITPLWFNHQGSIIYRLNRAFDDKQSFRNPERDIQVNGPILNFLNYIDLQIMDKPENYSKSQINKIYQKYAKLAQTINKTRTNDLSKQTIVFNLSESFMDPTTFPTIKFAKGAKDPIPYIHSLKKTTTYGTMLSAGYGGGTANMEWESLTGFNMGAFSTSLTPYVQVVPQYKYYPTIGANFSYSSAVHPFIGTYYSRIEDYKRFKFNKFVYLGSKYKIVDQKKLGTNSYNSDFTTYANGLRQINSRKDGQFINLISIQNHMPYNNWYPHNPYAGKISGDLFSDGDVRTQAATYIMGTHYTDEAVKKFLKQIDKIKKPITLVFYGDHYPSVVPQSYTSKYPIQMHSTRYFIYSNKYARQHGAKAKLASKTNYVNTSDFIAMMLEQTNSKVTAYQALLTEVHKKLPALTISYTDDAGFTLVDQKGKEVDPKTLTSSQQALLKDYEMVQYDMTAGEAYALNIKGFYTMKK
ncbi:sulfatase-like hydrolase/transferase [Lactobacillus sp. 23-2]|uniref:LTA synthase family protein n=1 Tax=Lactobacillus sp. 23-2 TaxID=2981842 RepID=UPI003837627D